MLCWVCCKVALGLVFWDSIWLGRISLGFGFGTLINFVFGRS